ncbi:MAG TPA: WYL domain-containing protein, partial [Anaerolineales bacterium]|nr:WYL domain-containing protein [Anaerolineales bacterium]
AAREHLRLSMNYQGAMDREAKKRQIEPYALVFRAGLWYLVGYCHLRKAPRTFRVDRIKKLKILSQTFQMPEDFDIHDYLENEFKGQPVVRARLRFAPEMSHIAAANRMIWESVQENADGSADVTLTAPDLSWLASMALGFANWVTVLDPPELREMIREWTQATANLYQVPQDKQQTTIKRRKK